jgi:rhodanese-related sulfurtransferase
METASVQELAVAALRGETVVDVRNADEYSAGHVPNSVFMPLPTLPLRLSELDRHTPLYVICESGSRAFQACQFLQQHGYQAINVHGGMSAYRSVGLPVEAGLRDRVGSW